MGQEAISPSGVVAGGLGGRSDLVRSKIPRLIWTTGMVGSSRERVRAREEIAEWVMVAGALKGGCKEGTMEGVMKIIFEEGWVRSSLLAITQMCSTRGKND